ncbi:MAG: hypothetical protein HZC28_11770 [Spirochaetes bacterium]|nr:hypothetical protein [Spirochaetota bacterium]
MDPKDNKDAAAPATSLVENAKNLARETERYNIAHELARGNDAKAKALMNSDNKDVMNVRINFFEVNLKVAGCVSFFYYVPETTMLHLTSAVNYDKSILSISPHTGWAEYKQRLEEQLLLGKAKYELVNKVNKVFKETIESSRREDFIKFLDMKKEKYLKPLVEEILLMAFASKNFDVDIGIENINIIDFKLSEKESKGQKSDEQEPEPATVTPQFKEAIIQVKPLLSPVRGVIIYQIQEGDVIFINVNDSSTRGIDYLGRMITKYKDDNPKIPGVVKRIEKNLPRITIYVALEDGLVGKIEETDPLKILKVTAETAAETAKEFNVTAPAPKSGVWSIVAYAGIAIAVIAVVSIILMLIMSS